MPFFVLLFSLQDSLLSVHMICAYKCTVKYTVKIFILFDRSVPRTTPTDTIVPVPYYDKHYAFICLAVFPCGIPHSVYQCAYNVSVQMHGKIRYKYFVLLFFLGSFSVSDYTDTDQHTCNCAILR